MRLITASDIVEEFNSAQPTKAWLFVNYDGVSIACVDRHNPRVTHWILIPIDNDSRVGVARKLANVAGWPYQHMGKL